MGRNKYSEKEIKEIGKLLHLKNSANRAKQKEIRHTLRTEFEFNISDFNEPGKAFGDNELNEAIKRGAIRILDEATIEAMREKGARQGEGRKGKAAAGYRSRRTNRLAAGDEGMGGMEERKRRREIMKSAGKNS